MIRKSNTCTGLPRNWVSTTIEEIAATSSGGTPSRSHKDYYGGSIPWVKSGELRDGTVFRTEEFITELGLRSSSAKVFPAGTLCIALYGATVGRLGTLGMDAATNQAVCGIFVPKMVSSKYLFHFLFSQRHNLIELGKGGAQPNISQDIVRGTAVPLAPLAEQQRIVAKIEELLTKLDAGVESLRTARAQLKRYRQSILKAAVTGELTRQWRESTTRCQLVESQQEAGSLLYIEPAEKLLARILKERRAKWEAEQRARMGAEGKTPTNDDWKKGYREPAPADKARLPKLPAGWTWAHLDQLLSILRNGISIKPTADDGIPILRISSLRPMSVNLSDRRFLPENYRPAVDYLLKDGDLLFTRYNGNPSLVGICGVVRNVRERIVHPDKLIRGQVASDLSLPTFLQIVLNVGESREFISKRARTTAGQTGISGSDLRVVPIPLAPVDEQKIIVQEVERCISIADSMELSIEQSLRQAERMRQSILKKAFEGKLVPQDPDDEPAELLLERIKVERAKQEAEKLAAKPSRKRFTKKRNKRSEGIAA